MKRILFISLFVIAVFSFLIADTKSNMAAGNAAYRKGNLEEALKYYDLVLEEEPSDQLFEFTDKIRKKIEEKKRALSGGGRGSNTPVLIAMDVLLLGFAIFSYADYNASTVNYENLFKEIDNTTPENYRILEYEQKMVDQKGNLMAFTLGAAGAAIVYTLIDAFVINNASSPDVRAEINPQERYAGLKTNWRF